MKNIYNKPTIEITNLVERYELLSGSQEEPQVTENIGAKENDLIFDWDNINEFSDLWVEADNEEDF